ncbi:transposase, partial [Colletotrichum incanum]
LRHPAPFLPHDKSTNNHPHRRQAPQLQKMATDLQAFGPEISGNRGPNDELSQIERVAIVTAARCGKSYSEISRAFGCTRSTVRRTIQRYAGQHPTGWAVTFRQQYHQLRAELNGRVSIRTIKRILRKANIKKWRAAKRPFITKEAAAQRLAFVREWLPKIEELIQSQFSDEASCQNNTSCPSEWVFRLPAEKWK